MSNRPPVPEHLYRYRSLDTEERLDQFEQSLKSEAFYFSSPFNFNDPFDCRFKVVISGSDTKLRRMINAACDESNGLPKPNDKEIEDFVRTRGAFFDGDQFVRNHLASIGVLSLTTKPDNLLMWSHYGDCHRGACLRLSFQPTALVVPIRYTDRLPVINLCRLVLENPPLAERRLAVTTKSTAWQYEDEWRCIVGSGSRLLKCPSGTVTGVIFGCRITQQKRDAILKWVDESGRTIDCFQAVENSQNYSIQTVAMDRSRPR